jgi:N-acetylmuramic acid 6-phosphate etherase
MRTEQPNPQSRSIDQMPTLDMLRIINRQDQTVALAVEAALPQITTAVEAIAGRLQQSGRLIYVGAGTSGRLAVLDAAECPPTYGVPPDLVQAVMAGGTGALTGAMEGAEDDRAAARADLVARSITARDAVVGVTASGRTLYVLEAIAYARQVGAFTAGISCNVPAPLLEAVHAPIGVVVGEEVIAGSTRMKAGTAQKMILNMISTSVMIKLGKVYDNLMVDMQVTNQKLLRRAIQLIMRLTEVDETTAAALLARAENRVKTAVVMQRLNVSLEEARALLAESDGRLRDVIG